MKTTFVIRRARSLQCQALTLIVLLFPATVLPAYAFGEDELPSAPIPKLQLQGTQASLNVAPSKLDNGPAQASAPPAPALQIVILEGEDVSNNIKERTAREPIIQVQDENHKPVAGAAVLFSIDSQGSHAGASFLHGAKTYTGTTDADGKVTAHGFQPNTHAGQFHVNVTASKGQLTTHTSIAQTNVAAAASCCHDRRYHWLRHHTRRFGLSGGCRGCSWRRNRRCGSVAKQQLQPRSRPGRGRSALLRSPEASIRVCISSQESDVVNRSRNRSPVASRTDKWW